MIIISKEFSNVQDRLDQQSREDRRRRRIQKRQERQAGKELEAIQEDTRAIRRANRKDKEGIHKYENEAMLKNLKDQKFQTEYEQRMNDRGIQRHAERRDIQAARAKEDAEGTGNKFKRSIQDAKINTKYKLQDWSDNYYKATEGRSLGGDLVLAGAAVGAGYLAHKAIKKAKYDREQAKLQAEKKFKRG